MTTTMSPATIQGYLTECDFPVDKEELLNHLREKGADQGAIERLESFEADQFESIGQVTECIGEDDLSAMAEQEEDFSAESDREFGNQAESTTGGGEEQKDWSKRVGELGTQGDSDLA